MVATASTATTLLQLQQRQRQRHPYNAMGHHDVLRLLLLLFFFSFLLRPSNAVVSNSSRNRNRNRRKLGGELASFQITPFSTGSSVRQNFCDRYRALLDTTTNDGSITLRNALNGLHLNMVFQYGSGFPYFNYNNITGIDVDNPGVVAELLDYIAEQANFTWRNSFGVYTQEDKGIDKTWTELLLWTTDTYDISIDKWAQSTERLNMGVSYCDSWFDGSLILVDRLEPSEDERNKVNYGNWLRPFSTRVWLVTIATIVFSAFVYQFLESLSKERDNRSYKMWFMDNLYLSSINFTQNYAYEPTCLAGRVFGISFAFWTMLIGATYTANLASLLVERKSSPLRIKDIDDGIARGMSMCTYSKSFSDIYISKAYPQAKRVPKLDFRDMYDALNAGECDLVIDTNQAWQGYQNIVEFNPNCDLEWVGRTVQPVVAAFTTKVDPGVMCTGLVNEVFNYYLSEMKDNGFFDEQWTKFDESQSTPNFNCNANQDGDERRQRRRQRQLVTTPSKSDDDRRNLKGGGGGGSVAAAAAGGSTDEGNDEGEDSLTLEQMAGTFLLHSVGSALAIIIGILSYYQKERSGKKRGEPLPDVTSSLDNDERSAADESVQEQLDNLRKSQKELAAQMSVMVSMLSSIKGKLEYNDNSKNTLSTTLFDHNEEDFHQSAKAEESENSATNMGKFEYVEEKISVSL